MGKVLEFPSQHNQSLNFLDNGLREMLKKKGADAALIDFAAQQLTTIYAQLHTAEQHSFSVELPSHLQPQESAALYRQINEGLAAMRKETHTLLITMVAHLLLAQARLYQHERND